MSVRARLCECVRARACVCDHHQRSKTHFYIASLARRARASLARRARACAHANDWQVQPQVQAHVQAQPPAPAQSGWAEVVDNLSGRAVRPVQTHTHTHTHTPTHTHTHTHRPAHTCARAHYHAHTHAHARARTCSVQYWFNSLTGESSWTRPTASAAHAAAPGSADDPHLLQVRPQRTALRRHRAAVLRCHCGRAPGDARKRASPPRARSAAGVGRAQRYARTRTYSRV
jgi:hypothetical protein